LAADRLDNACGLVAGDGGKGVRVGALDEMQVRMAEPARGGADAHLMRPGLVDDDLFDGERLARFDQDGGFGHLKSPFVPLPLAEGARGGDWKCEPAGSSLGPSARRRG